MKKYDNKELIWIINSKTRECDVLYIFKESFLSLSTKKYIDPKKITSELTFLTSEALCDYIGINYRSEELYTENKIEKMLNCFRKNIKNFKTNNLKIFVNKDGKEIFIAALDKSSKDPFVYNLATGKKVEGKIMFDRFNKNWSFSPNKNLQVYSYENAKEYILKNKKIFALPILSILNKNYLSYEESNKFLKAFEKTYLLMKRTKQDNLEK